MALKEEKQEEIHVLMVTAPSQGHINPMLRLGKRLVDKGVHVSLATTLFGGHRMLKASIITSISGPNVIAGIPILFFSDGVSLDYDRSGNLDYFMETLAKTGPVNLSKLIKDYYHDAGKKLSCIINNPFVPWVIDAALDNQIPCAMHWIQPCSIYAIYYRFYNKLNQFPTLENPDISVELPGLPLLRAQDLPSFVLPSNPFGCFPKMMSDIFQNMEKYKWVLANSFLELEKEAIESMAEICPIRPVGPLVPPSLLGEDDQNHVVDAGISMWKADETSLEWLNNQAPSSVIYVAFGSSSLLYLPAKLMEAIATALKKSNRPFLWVVKQSEFLLSDGAGQLPLGFEEETKHQGLIVPWSPQTKVLAHPSIACFITHCGWNSMSETLAAGVPVIAFPQWTDQPTNAKLFVDVFKVGLRLNPSPDGGIVEEELEKCIREVLSGPKSEDFKKNVVRLKQAARAAVASGGSSDRNIQLFVDEISGNSS